MFDYYTVVPRGRFHVVKKFTGSGDEPELTFTVDTMNKTVTPSHRGNLKPETVERYLSLVSSWKEAGAKEGSTVTISKDLIGSDSFVVHKGMSERVSTKESEEDIGNGDPDDLRYNLIPNNILANRSKKSFFIVSAVEKEENPDKTRVSGYKAYSKNGSMIKDKSKFFTSTVEDMIKQGVTRVSADFALITLTGLEESTMSTQKQVNRLIEADVSRSKSIMVLGDFILSGMPEANELADKVQTTLKLKGLSGATFDDAYTALNALSDEELEGLYADGLKSGMQDLAAVTEGKSLKSENRYRQAVSDSGNLFNSHLGTSFEPSEIFKALRKLNRGDKISGPVADAIAKTGVPDALNPQEHDEDTIYNILRAVGVHSDDAETYTNAFNMLGKNEGFAGDLIKSGAKAAAKGIANVALAPIAGEGEDLLSRLAAMKKASTPATQESLDGGNMGLEGGEKSMDQIYKGIKPLYDLFMKIGSQEEYDAFLAKLPEDQADVIDQYFNGDGDASAVANALHYHQRLDPDVKSFVSSLKESSGWSWDWDQDIPIDSNGAYAATSEENISGNDLQSKYGLSVDGPDDQSSVVGPVTIFKDHKGSVIGGHTDYGLVYLHPSVSDGEGLDESHLSGVSDDDYAIVGGGEIIYTGSEGDCQDFLETQLAAHPKGQSGYEDVEIVKVSELDESSGSPYDAAISAVSDMSPQIQAMTKAYVMLVNRGGDEVDSFEKAFERLSGQAYVDVKKRITAAGAYMLETKTKQIESAGWKGFRFAGSREKFDQMLKTHKGAKKVGPNSNGTEDYKVGNELVAVWSGSSGQVKA